MRSRMPLKSSLTKRARERADLITFWARIPCAARMSV